MFLRRRELGAVYVPNSTIFPCFRCGKIFTNMYSVTHHLEKDVCLNRVPSRPLWDKEKKNDKAAERIRYERRKESRAAKRAATGKLNLNDVPIPEASEKSCWLYSK